MKKIKFKSIFTKAIAITLPIVVIVNALILALLYRMTYNYNLDKYKKEVTTAASVIEDFAARCDFNDESELSALDKELNKLCRQFDISYAYVLEIDEKANSEKYLAIGYGEMASESFKNERSIGDVVKGQLSKEQIAVARQESEVSYTHIKNRFDDTIVCYIPLSNQNNSGANDTDKAEVNAKIVAVEVSVSQVMAQFYEAFLYLGLITLVMSVAIVVIFAFMLKKHIANPARKISESMEAFSKNHKLKPRSPGVRDTTELGKMALSFNAMAEEIEEYIKDIENLNKEKHIQEAELNIAKKIQLGLLPGTALRTRDVNIDAFILPARNVGGDFYDYRVSEDGTVNLAIADVSGKGVAAALFVSRALTLLQMYCDLGLSPAEAITRYNDKLASHNPNKLFITTFFAKYNPKTKELTYTNAGHNAPYLISDSLIPLDDALGMAAGVFPGEKYEQATIRLSEGDALFMFTDGVNEAQNKKGELLSTPRLEEILKAHISDKSHIIEDVVNNINAFSEGAEQSDDITMMCLKTSGSFYFRELTVSSDVQNLRQINKTLEDIPDISEELRLNLNLMAEEIFVNLCSYAYKGQEGEIYFCINVADRVEICFKDSGTRYNPTKNLLDIEEYDHEHTVGGLGKFITFQIADDYEYSYENGSNVLKLIKNFN